MHTLKGDFCYIDDYQPSQRTLDAIDKMNSVIQMSGYLDAIMTTIPFFQIFAGRSTYRIVSISSQGWNVKSYDWETFSDAMKAIPEIKRNRLEFIALQETNFATGKDYAFWKCVVNAL